MKVLVGAFNQEKALVGAFSVIVKPMEHYTALVNSNRWQHSRNIETETVASSSLLPAYTAVQRYWPASSSASRLMKREMATSSAWTSVYILHSRSEVRLQLVLVLFYATALFLPLLCNEYYDVRLGTGQPRARHRYPTLILRIHYASF